MHLPKGLTLLVGPTSGTSGAMKLLIERGLTPDSWVAPRNLDGGGHDATQVVASATARLRSQYPVVVDTTNAPELCDPLVAAARRFGAPVAVVRTGTTTAPAVPGADVDCHADDVHGILWGKGLELLRDVDLVGDVHGQWATLQANLAELGYHGTLGTDGFGHPDGRLPVLLGDLVDKGPENLKVLEAVRHGVRLGQCLAVRGNHEQWLTNALGDIARDAPGPDAWAERLSGLADAAPARTGRAATLRELAADRDAASNHFEDQLRFLRSLPLHLVLDRGRLVAVHASVREDQLRPAESTRDQRDTETWALYGGLRPRRRKHQLDEDGTNAEHEVDHKWMDLWSSDATVVRGHVVYDAPTTRGNVVSVDTGAGDGRSLTAMRWPQREFVTTEVTAGLTALATV